MSGLQRFKIVVAVDGGEETAEVLAQAFDQASRHERPELHVLRVVETSAFHRAPDPGEMESAQWALKEIAMDELETFAEGMGEWRVRLHVRPGRAVEEIDNLVAEVEPKLLVMGHGGGRHRRRETLGTVVEHVMRHAPVPVLVARTPDFGEKEAQPEQCPKCVEIREESQGETWFCETHQGQYLSTSTLLLPTGSFGLRGGPMW
jgi:nucleotide-binding universal stress UspA family protein